MRFRKTLTFLTLAIVLVCVLPAFTQQKPLTQDQVKSLVRDGFGDDSGAKLIEQRGIAFAPAQDFMQSLKAAGAGEAFLQALRNSKPSEPASAEKPLDQVQVIALLAGGVSGHRVTMLVRERGIDFEPTNEYLREVRSAGGEEELLGALKSAKMMKPVIVDPAVQARQTEIRQHMAGGAILANKGQYGAAEQEYRAALLLDSQNPDLYLSLSYVLFKQQKWDDGESASREAAHLNPNDAIAHYNISVCLGRKGDFDGEIAEAREALRLDPNLAVAHESLGVALAEKGDSDGSIAEERQALRLDPNLAEAHEGLGIELGEKKGDWDEAIAEEREALRLNPNYVEAHIELGAALGEKGDWDGEIREEGEALRLNPNLTGAHRRLGGALGEKGDWDGEIREEGEALRLDPNNAKAHSDLGAGLEHKGDLRGALDQYSAAHKLDPNDENYRRNYERLLQQVNQ